MEDIEAEMTEGDKVTLFFIIIISLLMLWLFLSGAWFRWNDAFDERAQGGTVEMRDGIKFLRPK